MGEARDCVVIGGGPAGGAFAALLRKRRPDLSVTLLEAARFPRYHIGESTIPAANGVLRELGLFEALERSSFVKKMGIVFVWGEDRRPWNADFLRLREVEPGAAASDVIDVTGQDFGGVLGELKSRGTPFTGFNVRRSEFDGMLLARARDLGVEVREGVKATGLERDGGGALRAVRWRDQAGREGAIETPFLLDGGGLNALTTRGERDKDPHMNNFAVYGYLRGAQWKVTYNGTRDRSTIFIAAVDKGWIWYFPIGEDVMSVGAVTHAGHFRDRLRDVDLEAFFWEMLRACPEVEGLTRGATLRDDVLDDGQRVAASRDWSSWARRPVGPGWAAAGDAAVFIDPILSSGVTLALQSAHRAAGTLVTQLARPELPAEALWGAYADYLRGEAGAFLTLARYFYGNNKAAPSWWWASQRVVNAAGRLQLDDHQSFTMATAGFFPTPRAIGGEVVGALVGQLGGAAAGARHLAGARLDKALPPEEALLRAAVEPLTPFRLALRSEPAEPGSALAEAGQLEVYWDLVPEGAALAHRMAAAPCRVAPMLAPVVDKLAAGPQAVADLLASAPSLVPGAPVAAVRAAALELVRIAALKGYARIV